MGKKLILLPNMLDPSLDPSPILPPILSEILPQLSGIIAESEKGARVFLKHFLPDTFRTMPIYLLNEHSTNEEIGELLEKLNKGEALGLISDSGLPILADPGAELVKRAHVHHIPIEAYPGPSSIILALMLSGLSGQSFTFHGYLPREIELLKKKIVQIKQEKRTHLFIEAPYRNEKLLAAILEGLPDELILCVAWNLTMPDQGVIIKKVKEWRKGSLPDLHKKPAVFVLGQS